MITMQLCQPQLDQSIMSTCSLLSTKTSLNRDALSCLTTRYIVIDFVQCTCRLFACSISSLYNMFSMAIGFLLFLADL